MKKIKLTIYFLIFSITCFTQNNTFKNYLKERETLSLIDESVYYDNYEIGLKHCYSIKSELNVNIKYYYISYFLYKKKKVKKSMSFLNCAFQLGYNIAHVDSLFYENNKKAIDKNYTINNQVYLKKITDINVIKAIWKMNTLDQEIRKTKFKNISDYNIAENKVDSINLFRLDSMVEIHGWIGKNIRGGSNFYDNEGIHPTLTIVHSNEKVNERYLSLVVNSCKKGEEDWVWAIFIMQNLLWRFYKKHNYNYIKLRHLTFDKKKLNIKADKTVLTNYCLSKSLRQEKSTIIIYPTKLWKNKSFKQQQNDLKNNLISYGVNPNQIKLSSKIIPMDEKEDIGNNYYFVFDYSEK